MQGTSTFKKWLKIIALGYTGGIMYTLMYIRYTFYDQMMGAMGVTNTQLALLTSISGIAAIIVNIPGGYFADKFDAKKCLMESIIAMTVCAFLFAAFCDNYAVCKVIWFIMPISIMAYWPSLIKYINSMGGEGNEGASFGNYYLINGLSGALGNVVALAIYNKSGSLSAGMYGLAVMYLIAVVVCFFALDDEKKLAERGIYLKGDEPIKVKYIWPVIKWPGFWILSLFIMCDYALYSNLSYFAPYLTNVMGIPENTSSALAIVRQYGIAFIAPLGGILADKVFKSTAKAFMVNMVITAALIAIVFFFSPDSNPVLVAIYSIVPSFVVYLVYSIQYSIIRHLHFSPVVVGTAIGIGGLAGNLGNVIFPAYFGSLLDKFGNDGYRYVFISLIALAGVVFLIAFWASRLDKDVLSGKKAFKLHGDEIPATE